MTVDILRGEYIGRHITARCTRPGAQIGLGELIELFKIEVLERHVGSGKDENKNQHQRDGLLDFGANNEDDTRRRLFNQPDHRGR